MAHLALAAGAGLAALALAASSAAAHPGVKTIFQQQRDGRWAQVGEIFVPDKVDRSNYVEHWVLFAAYVYPSATNQVVTKIDSSDTRVESETQFFAQRFAEGQTRHAAWTVLALSKCGPRTFRHGAPNTFRMEVPEC